MSTDITFNWEKMCLERRTRTWQTYCEKWFFRSSRASFQVCDGKCWFLAHGNHANWGRESRASTLVCWSCHNEIPHMGWLNNRNLLPHSSRGWKFWDQGVAKTGSFLGCQGESVPCLSLAFWWFSGSLWHCSLASVAWPRPLPLSSHDVLSVACLCASVPPFYEDTTHTGSGAHPTLIWPHLNWMNSIFNDSISK